MALPTQQDFIAVTSKQLLMYHEADKPNSQATSVFTFNKKRSKLMHEVGVLWMSGSNGTFQNKGQHTFTALLEAIRLRVASRADSNPSTVLKVLKDLASKPDNKRQAVKPVWWSISSTPVAAVEDLDQDYPLEGDAAAASDDAQKEEAMRAAGIGHAVGSWTPHRQYTYHDQSCCNQHVTSSKQHSKAILTLDLIFGTQTLALKQPYRVVAASLLSAKQSITNRVNSYLCANNTSSRAQECQPFS
jgi:hypothetical protein